MRKSDIHVGDYVWFNKNTVCGKEWDRRSPEVICEVLEVPTDRESLLICPIDPTIDIAPWQQNKSWIRSDGSFYSVAEYLSPCRNPSPTLNVEVDFSFLL